MSKKSHIQQKYKKLNIQVAHDLRNKFSTVGWFLYGNGCYEIYLRVWDGFTRNNIQKQISLE